MTKFGVISDTHIYNSSQSLPECVIEAFRKVDLVIHAGDWVDICVLEQLKPVGKIIGVCGNMDNESISTFFPEVQELEIEGIRIGITHGWGPSTRLEERISAKFKTTPDLIIYGHTHEAVFHKKNGIWYLNPGSPTDTYRAPHPTYAMLHIDQKIHAEILNVY